MIALAAMEGELDAIVKSVIEAAKAGDMVAARLVVDKLIAAAKDRPVSINLPQITDVATCNQAQAQITTSVASGDLLLGESDRAPHQEGRGSHGRQLNLASQVSASSSGFIFARRFTVSG